MSGEAFFEEVERRIELRSVVGVLLHGLAVGLAQPVYLVDKPLEIPKSDLVRNSCTAEKDEIAFLVRLQERFRYIWSVDYKLHVKR